MNNSFFLYLVFQTHFHRTIKYQLLLFRDEVSLFVTLFRFFFFQIGINQTRLSAGQGEGSRGFSVKGGGTVFLKLIIRLWIPWRSLNFWMTISRASFSYLSRVVPSRCGLCSNLFF